MNKIITRLNGVTFEDAQENIKLLGCRDIGWYAMIREPNNPHDPNAIRVTAVGKFMGYIPKDIARTLAPQMDNGSNLMARFVCRNQSPYYSTVGLTVEIVESPWDQSGLKAETVVIRQ
jgi:hypothetical protein